MSGRGTRGWLTRLAVVVTSFFIFSLLMEFGARAYLFYGVDQNEFFRYATLDQLKRKGKFKHPKTAAHPRLGTYPAPNYQDGPNRHNSMGYRGDEITLPKPEGEFRIVCLGGSTTYTSEVKDDRFAYPKLLEDALRAKGYSGVRVINGGSGGWNTWITLMNLEFRVLELDPDLIIVYHGVNDVHERFVWPSDNYLGDRSRTSRPIAPEKRDLIHFLKRSTLLRVLMIRAGWILPDSSIENLSGWRSRQNLASLYLAQIAEKVYPLGFYEQVTPRQILETNKPIYFLRNLKCLIAVARSRGIRTVLASFKLSKDFPEKTVPSLGEYHGAVEEQNRYLRALAGEMGEGFFDFASVFPDDRRYYKDGVHVNESGAVLKAYLFARYLSESGLLPPPELPRAGKR